MHDISDVPLAFPMLISHLTKCLAVAKSLKSLMHICINTEGHMAGHDLFILALGTPCISSAHNSFTYIAITNVSAQRARQ